MIFELHLEESCLDVCISPSWKLGRQTFLLKSSVTIGKYYDEEKESRNVLEGFLDLSLIEEGISVLRYKS